MEAQHQSESNEKERIHVQQKLYFLLGGRMKGQGYLIRCALNVRTLSIYIWKLDLVTRPAYNALISDLFLMKYNEFGRHGYICR